MCNLYRMKGGPGEAATLFGDLVPAPPPPSNASEEVYPGTPGIVLAEGQLRQMTWGFPLVLTGAKGQKLKPKPVNNARTDKLAGPFWSASFRSRRCLIPASDWAEAQGPRGAMTRTWINPAGETVFALAGLWRSSDEWGDVFSMIMTDASPAMQGVHTRMPVVLARGDWGAFLGESARDAFKLCKPWQGALDIAHTDQPWAGRR